MVQVGEYIIQAYKNGSFHVVIEMADLQKQLEYSYSFHLLLLRKQLVVLTESVHTLESLKQSLHQIFSPEIKGVSINGCVHLWVYLSVGVSIRGHVYC